LGHSNEPNTCKSHDKKRKADHSVDNVERPRRNKEYWPRLGEFEGFLDQIYIFHPRGNIRPKTMTDFKVPQMRSSRRLKRLIKKRSLKTQRATSSRLTSMSTTSMVDLTPMSQGGSRSSLPEDHGSLTRHPQVLEVVQGPHHLRPQ
jgi:hypothetical protein